MPWGGANDLGRRTRSGPESFGRQAWGDAYAQLSAADRESPLEPEDLERLATATYLIGRDVESEDLWARAHHEWLRLNDAARAARCAFWLGFGLLLKGEPARGAGWLARARRLLDDAQLDCVEQGYLLVPVALRCRAEGDHTASYTTFGQAAKIRRPLRRPGPDDVRTAWPGPGSDQARRDR